MDRKCARYTIANDQLPGKSDDPRGGLPAEAGQAVRRYVQSSISPNTKKAYAGDLRRFQKWGGSIPSSPEEVASYIAMHASRPEARKPATLNRWVSAISYAHRTQDFPDPTTSEMVKATLAGIKREHGIAQDQAEPLLLSDLKAICVGTGGTLFDLRDRALLLVGFAAALRREELVGIEREHLTLRREGVRLWLPRSKTDQQGEGHTIGIPRAPQWGCCPVEAMERWLGAAEIQSGPVFRRVNRGGSSVAPWGMGESTVNAIIKRRASWVGLDPSVYSGHSLRAGLATTAAQQHVDKETIRQQTRHSSDEMLNEYIRDAELFDRNVVGQLS